MKNNINSSLLILSLILSGCSLLGPKYHSPDINVPKNWTTQKYFNKNESVDITQIAWWKVYKDKDLDSLIIKALQNNNNLQMAMGNILQARASLSQVNMNWIPTVPIGASGFTGQVLNPGFSNNSSFSALDNYTPNSPQNFSGYSAGFIPSYTLNIFSQIKQTEIAKLNLEMRQEAFSATKLAVISQVVASYFNLLGLQEQLTLQNKLLLDSNELLRYTQIQYNMGSISASRLTALNQYIATIKAKIPEIKTNITQTENAIQVLINENPGKIMTHNNFNSLKINNTLLANLPSSVLKSRPDIKIAEYQLKLANANIGAVTAQFFPTISLTGALGQGSLQLGNLFSAGGDFWASELAATMPMLNLGLYSQIDQAKAAYYFAYYNYLNTVRNSFAQIDNNLASYHNLNTSAEIQKQSLVDAQLLYDISYKQFKRGSISYLDTLEYKLNVDYEKASLNHTKIQQLNGVVTIYQNLGGGYNVESQISKIKKIGDTYDIK